MKLLLDVKRKIASIASPRAVWAALAAAIFGLLPAIASADETNVVLKFSKSDNNYLFASIGFGVLALCVAVFLWRSVINTSPGDEKMQSVGKAIKEGALAYLLKQVKTMGIFVILLAVGLFFLFRAQYNSNSLGAWLAVCFVGGVAASYIAGYTGMLMAVEGNMRTANAALSSYARTLRTAFRSGAVAGMVTVGMGLIGASIIFLAARENAMKLLIGFGFGGSLAALFMRVGGGIFTKAADVGADLVGKVEAGIPEDDPRNPATIADNVGDNVGDCAGMAADIFESYEVTLVAAIILGAATSSIFDQSTWMKLILFALMARGVGIVASIFGIFGVRGSDDLDADPLLAIRKGFWLSAGIAALATLGLAYFLMGGQGTPIQTAQAMDVEGPLRAKMLQVQKIRDDLSKTNPTLAQNPQPIIDDPRFKAMGVTGTEAQGFVQQALAYQPDTAPPIKDFSDFHAIDFSDANDPANKYSVLDIDPTGQRHAKTLAETYGGSNVKVARLQLTSPPPPPVKGQPQQPAQVQELFYGPVTTDQLTNLLQTANKQRPGFVKELAEQDLNVTIYSDGKGNLAFGVEPKPGQQLNLIQLMARGGPSAAIFKESPAAVEQALKNPTGGPTPTPIRNLTYAEVEHHAVGWYWFALCIIFGIAMAFGIELLTDYYVSTHKRPVQEVAGVSTAGPAPMIIQGFALASESSVFSVFMIVVALITPLLIFPPASYGGSYLLSFYGIALVGLGLLTTTGFILAMDTFGPISDNAQGVFEMSGAGHTSVEGSKAVQRLDAAGNTTKALTKGFAIATAVVAAVALFHSYLESGHLQVGGIRVDLPEIFLGFLIGGAAPYLFSAFSINAVGRAAFQLINEVRRQFREDAGIMAGTSKPNYGRCVAIVTEAAQKELLGPAILAIALPVAVGFGFSIGKQPDANGYLLTGAEALGGFLAGAILSGQLLAVLLANSGGIWDNSKKLIEDGLYGGKGSDAHKAGVVVDTVGDPFKDTAGPAMNPLIKVMNLVSLLLVPFMIKPMPMAVLTCITGAAVLSLIFSIWFSKRASFSSALNTLAETAAPSALTDPEKALPPQSKKRLTVEDTPPTSDETPEPVE